MNEEAVVNRLNSARYLYLRDLSQPHDNSLRLAVEEAIVNRSEAVKSALRAIPHLLVQVISTMWMRKNSRLVVPVALLLLFGWNFCMAQSQSPASEAQLHFLRGKKLVEANCTDCEGGTQAGMEQAINELLDAIRGGFSKQVAAYKLLSDAYADMATYVEKADPKKSKEYWSKQEDVKRKLYELDPKDPEIKADYINILKTDDEKIPLLRKTLESDPGSPATASASYQLGIILIRKNQLTEGLNLAANGVNKEFAPNGVRTEAAELMHVLDERGCPLQNEEELSKELDDSFAKAMQGSDEDGDPVAMSGFKQDFLNAIKKHECKAQR